MALISNHQGDLSPLKTRYVLPGEANPSCKLKPTLIFWNSGEVMNFLAHHVHQSLLLEHMTDKGCPVAGSS
jgi:hypothetical protein